MYTGFIKTNPFSVMCHELVIGDKSVKIVSKMDFSALFRPAFIQTAMLSLFWSFLILPVPQHATNLPLMDCAGSAALN